MIPQLQKSIDEGGFDATNNRDGIGIVGTSLGGLSACHTALRHPHLFFMVVAQSASFWWYPGWHQDHGDIQRMTKYEWMDVFSQDKSPSIQFYLQSSAKERLFPDAPLFAEQNGQVAQRLKHMGHEVDCTTIAKGGHHYRSWQMAKPPLLKRLTQSARFFSTDPKARIASESKCFKQNIPQLF